MRRFDITLISIGIIWIWVIIATVVVMGTTSPVLEMIILEIDGAIACMLTLWLKRSTFIGKHATGITGPPIPPDA